MRLEHHLVGGYVRYISPYIIIIINIIAELYQYRRTRSIKWKTVLEIWWPKLFPEKDIPSSGTVITSWDSVVRKKALLSRDSSKEIKDDFLNKVYSHPSKPMKPAAAVEIVPPEEEHDPVNNNAGYNTDDSGVDVELSPYLLRRHGDTIAILHELLEQEKQEKTQIQQQLNETETLYSATQHRITEAEEARKDSEFSLKKMVTEHKKQCSKYERELKKANELGTKLRCELVSLQTANVVRRLASCNKNLSKQKERINTLEKEVQELHDTLTELRRIRKNKTEQVRNNVAKCTEAEQRLDT